MEKRYYYEDSIKNVAEEIRREYGCEQVVIVNYEYRDMYNGGYYEVEFYLIF